MASQDAVSFRRLKTVLNLFLLLMQLVIVAAYWGMLDARPSYMVISQERYPGTDLLMNSGLADVLVSLPVMLAVVAIFVASVVKEFVGIGKARRIGLNLLLLSVLLLVFSMAAVPLYATTP